MIVGFLVGWFGGCRFSGWLDGSPAASSPPAAFSWLASNAIISGTENCRAIGPHSVNLAQFHADDTDLRKAMSSLPPLVKGYLRLGAKIGSHAVIDYQFGTTDVLVVLKVDQINPRYLAHFGVDASRFAA